MAEVVPTINAASMKEFGLMMDRVEPFAPRVHVDICDGIFADGHTPNLAQVYGPKNALLDLHLMLKDPESQFENAVSLKPSLIIYHMESDGDILRLISQTQELGIKAGVAILPHTSIDMAAEVIKIADHALIFTGNLGHNGGEFQSEQLVKANQVKDISPVIEISVDGGVNDKNALLIAKAGVDVLYAGDFIHTSEDPRAAYQSLLDLTVAEEAE